MAVWIVYYLNQFITSVLHTLAFNFAIAWHPASRRGGAVDELMYRSDPRLPIKYYSGDFLPLQLMLFWILIKEF